MTVNFASLVPVELVDIIGISIGVFILSVVLFEIVRWRKVLSPILKAMNLGGGIWLQTLAQTIANEAVFQQIDIGFEKRKWLSHSLVMWGFLLLGVSTTLNWIYDPKGYSLSVWHSVRIVGNVGGILFITGLAIIVLRYSTDNVKRDSGTAGGYLFAFLLIMAGITGFASEFASELNAAKITYYVYPVHLLFCAALLVTSPFTKFVHAIGRPLLRLSENYLAILNSSQKSPLLMPLPKSEVNL